MSYGIFKLINLINPIRVSVEEEELGLDETQHNEKYLQGTLLVSDNGHMKEETLSDF
jgi:Amt family ammonium transporter